MINTMQQYLARTATKQPNQTALVYGKKRYTYATLEEKSTALAAYLQAIGVQRGDRVVLCLGNTPQTVIAFWAVLKAGAIVSNVGVNLKPEKLQYILNDSGAKVLIATGAREDDNYQTYLHQSPALEHIIVADGILTGSAVISDFETTIHFNGGKLKPVGTLDIDLASIIYTSGSTGEPKGVMMTHRNMITATESLNAYLQYQDTDKVISALPLSFDYGLYQMLMCISTGATLILEADLTWPILFLKKIAEEKATVFPAVPTAMSLLYEHSKKTNFDMSSIRILTNTGAAMTPSHITVMQQLFPQASIFSMYGLTECKRCTYLPPQDINRKPTSVGIAIPNTELWLVDEQGNKLGPNQIGQLVIRGGTVMKGYWNKPEKTAEKLKDGPIPGEKVLYTGDYCMLDEEGYLYFKGRMDAVIKSKGIKVSPKEVEDFLYAIDDVKEAAVIGVPHAIFGDVLYAFIETKHKADLTEHEVRSRCMAELEKHLVPEYFTILPSLPKTANGKLNKLGLKEKAKELLSTNQLANA